jgi:hypothetical protein
MRPTFVQVDGSSRGLYMQAFDQVPQGRQICLLR